MEGHGGSAGVCNGEADLSCLAGLTKVKRVFFNGSENIITDLSFLSGMTELQELHIQGDLRFKDLTPLKELTKLTTLSITTSGSGNNPADIKNLSPLTGMTELRELQLSVIGVSDLSPLAGMTKLTVLRMHGGGNGRYSSITDLSPLKNLTNLRELNMFVAPDVKDFSPLAGLTQLTSLHVYGDYSCTDYSFLSGLTELRDLSFSGSSENTMKDCSAVRNLTKLQILNLTASRLESFVGLENLTELTELRLNGEDATYTDLKPLTGLTKLQSIHLPNRKYDYEHPLPKLNIDGLAGMTQLKELDLYSAVESLAPLSGLTNLKSLYYSGNYHDGDSGVSLAPLASLTGLTDLSLNCQVPSNDLSPLASLTELRTPLTLYVGDYNHPVRDISPLKNLTNLSSFTMGNAAEGLDTSPVAHVASVTIQ